MAYKIKSKKVKEKKGSYEYKVLNFENGTELQDRINNLSKEGWVLQTASGNNYVERVILKRRKK